MKDKIKEIKLQHQINTLENENETLKNIIKESCIESLWNIQILKKKMID